MPVDPFRLIAVLLAVLGALSALGWLLEPSLTRAVGFLGFAFAAFVVGVVAPDFRRSHR